MYFEGECVRPMLALVLQSNLLVLATSKPFFIYTWDKSDLGMEGIESRSWTVGNCETKHEGGEEHAGTPINLHSYNMVMSSNVFSLMGVGLSNCSRGRTLQIPTLPTPKTPK